MTPDDSTPVNLRPSRKLWLLGVLVVITTLIVGLRIWENTTPSVDPGLDTGARLSATFVPPAELDRLIDAYEQRVTETETPSNYILLGELYLEKARVTGDLSRYLQAEAAFDIGRELRPEDPAPLVGQARVDLALHRFDSAIDRVNGLSRLDAVAVIVDAHVALGDLSTAEDLLDILAVGAEDAGPILIRRSQLAWLRGDRGEAMRLAGQAVDDNDPNPRRRAFYQSFAGQMAFQTGDHEMAGTLGEKAVESDPESIAALAVLARASYAVGDLERAAGLLEDATSPVPDPTFLDELGDVYTAMGRDDDASRAYETIEVLAELGEASEAYDRAVADSLADRGVDTERAVRIATEELSIRRDAHTLDSVAWALFRDGRPEEAVEPIEEALASGIQDARVLYHAGEIFAALGDTERARSHLEAALDVNRHFDVLGGRRAVALLEDLR